MKMLKSDEEVKGECGFCGGLGHSMLNCNKLEAQKMKTLAANCINTKDGKP